MTVGGSIALIVVGAILTFALEIELDWLNLDAMGVILMAAGAVGLVFGLIWLSQPTRVDRRTLERERAPGENRDLR